MKTNKWVARVRGNDKDNWIKIGIVKVSEGYEIIAENKDDVSTGIETTRESAIEAVKLVWGNWGSFEWLDEKSIISQAAALHGRKGGKVKSERKAKTSAENGKLGGRPRIYGNILTNRDVIEAKGYVLTQTAAGKLVRSEPFKERVYSINGVDCAEMDSRSTANGSILHFFALEEIERNEHGWYIKPTRQARYLWKSWHKNKPEIPRYGYSVLKDEEFYEK